MKKYTVFLSFLVASFGFIGCSEEFDESFGKGASKGDQIKFAAYIEDNTTRTAYGPLTDGAYPVYWVNGDKVKIWSPQATNDPNNLETTNGATATYTVANVGDNVSKYSLSGATEENALYWGNGDGENGTHDFYTFYPANANNYTTDDGTFVFAVPREQDAVVTKTGDDAGYTYTAVDMNAAIMAGCVTIDRATYNPDTEIVLPFKPLTTAFDIEILPPGEPSDDSLEGEVDVDEVWITSVTIANDATLTSGRKILAGGFTYDVKNGGTFAHYTNTATNEDAGSYTVNVMLKEPVCLRRGKSDTLKVTGFMLPEIRSSSADESGATLRVIVNCRRNTSSGEMKAYSKNVSWTAENKSNIENRKCTVPLGLLPNPIVFSYETWMANLPEDTYVSQISLPGSHDSGTYDPESGLFQLDNAGQTQFLSMYEQLNAGIRCMDFRPGCKYNFSSGTYTMGIAHGWIQYEVTFADVVTDVVKWLAEHPTEFVILKMKNESSGQSRTGTGSLLGVPVPTYTDNFDLWQKYIIQELKKVGAEYLIDDFDPYMTLKEARGKVLFMSRDHYLSGPDGTEEDGYGNHWVGCKISGWPDDNPTLMTGKTFFTPSHTRDTGGIGGFSVSDVYRGDSDWLTNAPGESTKKAAIDGYLTACRDNTCGKQDYGEWYFVYLNVRGDSRYTDVYNKYMVDVLSRDPYVDTYKNVGVVLLDWAAKTEENLDTETKENPFGGYEVIKAVVDNNFKGDDGPDRKTN